MLVQVTYSEGGLWFDMNINSGRPLMNYFPRRRPVAIKYGKWIYDFRLRELGLNPIRPWITYN